MIEPAVHLYNDSLGIGGDTEKESDLNPEASVDGGQRDFCPPDVLEFPRASAAKAYWEAERSRRA